MNIFRISSLIGLNALIAEGKQGTEALFQTPFVCKNKRVNYQQDSLTRGFIFIFSKQNIMNVKHIIIAASFFATAGAAFAEGGVYPPESTFTSTLTREQVFSQIRPNDPNMSRNNAYPVPYQASAVAKEQIAMHPVDGKLYSGA